MTHRQHLRPDGFPSRSDMALMSPAELAIFNVVGVVEAAGASPALTDAINLLHKARDRVAEGNGG